MTNKTSFYDILREPVLSEKSNNLLEKFNKYVFKVQTSASKNAVKKAVESIFGVKVSKVNALNMEGKTKIFKGVMGKRKDYKKMIVTLAEGNVIDFNARLK
jgi:large subunit ribosomal protein L23